MNDLMSFQCSPPPDNAERAERVARPFPYELVLVLVTAVLLPLTDAAQETGPYQISNSLNALFFKLPCLLVMLALCVSVLFNKRRSGLAKLFASAGAVFVACLLYTPIATMIHYLLLW